MAIFRNSWTYVISFMLLSSMILGCHTVPFLPDLMKLGKHKEKESRESQQVVRLPPYLFMADFALNDKDLLFKELKDLGTQVARELQLPECHRLIKVHLFETRDTYEEFMEKHYPGLPKRRAFFVAQPDSFGGGEDLLVFTYWGDRIRQDLRHELTHALLHSVLKDVPLWLDEGLAEFFETPTQFRGVNYDHLALLKPGNVGGVQPDLPRLEKLSEVDQMNPSDYREAWGWVHFMLRGNPKAKQILISYLRELRSSAKPGLVEPRLKTALGNPRDAMLAHLSTLNNRRPDTQVGAR